MVLKLCVDFADNVLVVPEAFGTLSVRLAGAAGLVALVVERALAEEVHGRVLLQLQFPPAYVTFGVGEHHSFTLKKIIDMYHFDFPSLNPPLFLPLVSLF